MIVISAPSRPRPHAKLAGVVLMLVLGAGAACDATDDPAAGKNDFDAFTAGPDVQVPDVLSDLGGDRFAGLEVRGQHIVSYWAGVVPTETREYAESEPEGMTIELVTSARYSRDELNAAVERIVNSDVGRHAAISWASAESDGSGLEIAVEAEPPSLVVRQKIAALAALPADAIRYISNAGPVMRTPASSGS